MTSPTARTLGLLRRRGYAAEVCERWIAQAGIRRDLFGCMDILAVHPQEAGALGVQATTASHLAARVRKSARVPALRTWLAAGNRFQVWGWAKHGRRWRVKVVAVQLPDLAGVILEAPPGRPGGRKWTALPLFPGPGGDAEEQTPARQT
jgi:hypothetical protein